mgnify:FL=1
MMPFAEYVAGIKFHTVQPDMPSPAWWPNKPDSVVLELANLSLPTTEATIKDRLRQVACISRMSTLANGALINYGVSCLSDTSCYVNVGIWQGYSLLAGMVGNPDKCCIGVDNFSLALTSSEIDRVRDRFAQARSRVHHLWPKDYAEYFTTIHTQPIGFYFYDGDHSYGHQLRGLQLAEPFFTDDCIVMVDDTNWPAPRQATLDFLEQSPHTYRMLLDSRPNTIPVGAHPTFWNGIMLFQRSRL